MSFSEHQHLQKNGILLLTIMVRDGIFIIALVQWTGNVRIDPPFLLGSAYYNYKDFYSIILLAVVDAQLRFIYIDLGTNGRMSDSYVWNKCVLYVII